MKKQKTNDSIEIVLGDDQMKCIKCLHVRPNEPYAKQHYAHKDIKFASYFICWRCCRDAEGTFMILQKWPLAFERVSDTFGFRLRWSPGVKELVGKHVKG